MTNLFSISISYRARLSSFSRNMVRDNWLLLLIFNFSNLRYTFSTLWLLLNLKYETTSQHSIDLIDIQRHDPCNSNSDCGNRLYYMSLIELSNSCFFNASRYIHKNMLFINVTSQSWYFAWLDCFNITSWKLCRSYSNKCQSYPESYNTKDFGVW